MRPGVEPASSWMTVRFVSAEPPWELQKDYIFWPPSPITPTHPMPCLWQSPICSLYLWVWLVRLDSTYKWDRIRFVFLCLAYFIECPQGSSMLSQMARFPSFYGWIIFYIVSIYRYIYLSSLFLHPLIDTGCFCVLAIIDNIVMNVRDTYFPSYYFHLGGRVNTQNSNCWILW